MNVYFDFEALKAANPMNLYPNNLKNREFGCEGAIIPKRPGATQNPNSKGKADTAKNRFFRLFGDIPTLKKTTAQCSLLDNFFNF